MWRDAGEAQRQEWVVSHPRVVDKNWEVHFLQQDTLLIQGVKAVLPNTQKQTKGGCENEETKKYGPNEGTEQNSRKRTK